MDPRRFSGKGNGKLEAFKFMLYVSIPVVASIIYGTPDNMQKIVQQFKFVEYPPEEKEDVLIGQSVQGTRKRGGGGGGGGRGEAGASK